MIRKVSLLRHAAWLDNNMTGWSLENVLSPRPYSNFPRWGSSWAVLRYMMGRAQFKRTSQHTHKVIPADLCPPLNVKHQLCCVVNGGNACARHDMAWLGFRRFQTYKSHQKPSKAIDAVSTDMIWIVVSSCFILFYVCVLRLSLPLTVQFITDGACFCLCCGLGDLCVVAVSCHEAIHCVSTSKAAKSFL
jgi:hypothetical protein